MRLIKKGGNDESNVCDCVGFRYRGFCSHISAKRVEGIELPHASTSAMESKTFLALLRLDRFITQFWVPEETRKWLRIGRKIAVDDGEVEETEISKSLRKFRGTILEVYDFTQGKYIAIDVVYFKGDDVRGISLRDRLVMLNEVANKSGGLIDPLEFKSSRKEKEEMHRDYRGDVIIRDLSSTYPIVAGRSWIVEKNKKGSQV